MSSYRFSNRSCSTRASITDNCISLLFWSIILIVLLAFWWPLLSYSWHYWVD